MYDMYDVWVVVKQFVQFVANLPGLLGITVTRINWCSYQPCSTIALMWTCVIAEIYEGGMCIYQDRGYTISKASLLPSSKVVLHVISLIQWQWKFSQFPFRSFECWRHLCFLGHMGLVWMSGKKLQMFCQDIASWLSEDNVWPPLKWIEGLLPDLKMALQVMSTCVHAVFQTVITVIAEKNSGDQPVGGPFHVHVAGVSPLDR